MGKTYEIEQFIKEEIQTANEHVERPSTHHQKIEIKILRFRIFDLKRQHPTFALM